MSAEISRGAQHHPSELPSRRRFLQAGGAAAAGAFGLLQGASPAAASLAEGRSRVGKRPNFLILMVDEMRYPPVYESRALQEFRRTQLGAQELLRGTGMDFTRHYAASVACVPSRTSLYTGHYPSLHGVTQTTGAAKAEFDPDVFWLDPSGLPTMGDYFRAAGYQTYWRGKWHGSAADMIVPGTKDALVTYDEKGIPDPAAEAQYLAGNRLDGYGFSGWIGPEPHGQSPLNSGSSAKDARGRDAGFADQARHVIEALDQDHRQSDPWLMMVSFVNPHDITLYGLLLNLGGNFDFHVDPAVPSDLFDPVLFQRTLHDDLATKPSCQASYQSSYAIWMQPVVDRLTYSRFYYSLHKEVDQRMREVYAALRASRFYEDTIVIFTSDHGDLLGSHGDMHQKWYTMYDEALRIPLIISNPRLFPRPQTTSALTSHVDLLPTMLGLAGLDAEGLRKELAKDHTDAVPLVGRNLAGLVTGKVDPAKVREPLYFMTDDDPSRGLNQNNWTGIAYASVTQPNHIEAVIAQLGDGKVWKYARYFDSAQFWSTPGTPGDTQVNVEDVVLQEIGNPPDTDGTSVVPFKRTVKHTPLPDELEMYNVSDDPMELANLAGQPAYAKQEKVLAALLREQCAKKRLTPVSGQVPGQPTCQG